MHPTTVYSISELTAYIKSLFEGDLLLNGVWLSGEVSNFKQAPSGHCYFTLKDRFSSIRAVLWRTQAKMTLLPQDGQAVIAHGHISVYEQRGDYQLYVDRIEPDGVGWLWQEYQRLKEQLSGEGLFDEGRKRPIPVRPVRLGIATSLGAAALRDVLRTLNNRYPLVDVILSPCSVQGEEAPAAIVAALERLQQWSMEREPLDAIIVARGGGSIEELWAFNDERVARAIAASCLPVISGVGHETDMTIADYVADLRAATPTAAATAAVCDVRELSADLERLKDDAVDLITDRLAAARADVDGLAARLTRLSPLGGIEQDRQRLDDLSRRLRLAMAHRFTAWRERVRGQRLALGGLNPGSVLARGYAIVAGGHDEIIGSVAQVTSGDVLQIRVADGAFAAEVKDQEHDTARE